MARSRRKRKRARQHCNCWMCIDSSTKKKELTEKRDKANYLDAIRESGYTESDG